MHSPADAFQKLYSRASRPLQHLLSGDFGNRAMRLVTRSYTVPYDPSALPPELRDVDKFMVGFSGGKDSIACVLYLLELGVPRDRIELWHHEIDPHDKPFMDWPCTRAYCEAVADALGVVLLFSGKIGGFEQEMLRDKTRTKGVHFETLLPDGTIQKLVADQGLKDAALKDRLIEDLKTASERQKKDIEDRLKKVTARLDDPEYQAGTRLQFPQVTADLSVRWCSSYLKIDVASRIFGNDPRLKKGSYCLLTGERAQESASRAKYDELEPHRSDNKARRVFQWRPVHKWQEEQVWEIMARWSILPHPAYQLGFGRVSCMSCIFGNPQQWATVRALNPRHFEKIARYEEQFGKTIQRERSIREMVQGGFQAGYQERQRKNAVSQKLEDLLSLFETTESIQDRGRALDDFQKDLPGMDEVAQLFDSVLLPAIEKLGTYRGTVGKVRDFHKAIKRLQVEPKIAPPARPFLPSGSERLQAASQRADAPMVGVCSPLVWKLPPGAGKHDGGPT